MKRTTDHRQFLKAIENHIFRENNVICNHIFRLNIVIIFCYTSLQEDVHAPPELLGKIRLLWQNVPAQLAKENKKFIYTALKSGARAREYETALQWLDDAGMIRQVFRVSPPRLPLLSYQDFSAFKLYLHDVGLLGAMTGLSAQTLLEGSALFTNFRGSLTEQYVLQELIAIRTSLAPHADGGVTKDIPLYAFGTQLPSLLASE